MQHTDTRSALAWINTEAWGSFDKAIEKSGSYPKGNNGWALHVRRLRAADILHAHPVTGELAEIGEMIPDVFAAGEATGDMGTLRYAEILDVAADMFEQWGWL